MNAEDIYKFDKFTPTRLDGFYNSNADNSLIFQSSTFMHTSVLSFDCSTPFFSVGAAVEVLLFLKQLLFHVQLDL